MEAPVLKSPAETYEQFSVPSIFRPWAGELLRRVQPKPGERLLDVACGTGIVVREAAPMVGETGSVTGLDPNPGMPAVARSIDPPAGAAIEWRQGSADALPFADDGFDLVLCQPGLQFFTDRPVAMREMRRVLAPGGRVGAVVWRTREHQSLWAAFDDVHERRFGNLGGGEIICSLGDADEFVRLTVLGEAAVLPEFAKTSEAVHIATARV